MGPGETTPPLPPSPGSAFSLINFPGVGHLGGHVKIEMAVKEEGRKPRTETIW